MTLLRGILQDLLHFLMIVNIGAGVVVWVMGIRESLAMASHAPDGRGWFTLRRPLASELSVDYRAHRHQMIKLGFAFVAILVIEVLLGLLNNLCFRSPS
jgi:hypothetical protein